MTATKFGGDRQPFFRSLPKFGGCHEWHQIGNSYYTYIEPTLPGFSYQLFAIAPNTVSIASLQQLAGNANWLVGLGAVDVALSVIPGGTSAGYLEQGDYPHAVAWFLADVALTLSVVGKLGQCTMTPSR